MSQTLPSAGPSVLITGFEPFDGMQENLSQSLVKHLRSANLKAENDMQLQFAILPVSYRKTDEAIQSLLFEHQPDIVLAFGIGRAEELITIERIAVNIDDADNCDNCGETRYGDPIEPEGAAAYFANIPAQQILQSLRKEGISAKISNHAGAFLCNHLLYRLLHASNTSHCPSAAGFFHLPRVNWDVQTQHALEDAVSVILSAATGIRSY